MSVGYAFSINRNLGVNLVDQVTDGFRTLISSGRLKAGDAVPSRDRLARELGVSVRVVREAIAALVAEGLVGVRPRVGCMVLSPKARFWRKRILTIVPADFQTSYYCGTLLAGLQRELTENGCLFETVTLGILDGGRLELERLEEAVRLPPDFAVVLHHDRRICRLLADRGVACACSSDGATNETDFAFRTNCDSAFAALVADCVAKDVKSVAIFEYGVFPVLVSALMDAGIEVETISVPDSFGKGFLEKIQQKAMRQALARLHHPKRRPDLVVVTDDFVATGVLAGMSELGLRAPEDFGLVVWKNCGFGPVYPRTLTRFEDNPFDDAEIIAKAIVRRLRGKAVPPVIELPVSYCRGKTF